MPIVTYTCLRCGLRTRVQFGQDYRACACDAGYDTDNDAVPDVPPVEEIDAPA